MRQKLLIGLVCLVLSVPMALSEGEHTLAGTWSDGAADAVRVLELEEAEDGYTGRMTVDGETREIVAGIEGDTCVLYADGVRLGTLQAEEDFLLFTDTSNEVFPMLKNDAQLPEIEAQSSLEAFQGVWEADFAIVSGFRIPMGDTRMVYTIEEDHVTLSGTGYETGITLACDLREDGLAILLEEEERQLYLLRDGSMIRDTGAMIFHLVRHSEP
ncbi:MAG: hypothetical protein IJ229_01555 [Clostridia bacterium]|nr:hypothetical protein [Clostridia bacterium]MBR1683822.1 hypothetical protein [Clostridia bacterium]MBR2286941.1 hypothetical protein [Clostridia bacterium]